jgi:hypothetical protein
VKTIRRKLEKNSDAIKELYIEEIQRHLKRAHKLSRSEQIPESEFKTLLIQVPSFIINQMLEEIDIHL